MKNQIGRSSFVFSKFEFVKMKNEKKYKGVIPKNTANFNAFPPHNFIKHRHLFSEEYIHSIICTIYKAHNILLYDSTAGLNFIEFISLFSFQIQLKLTMVVLCYIILHDLVQRVCVLFP